MEINNGEEVTNQELRQTEKLLNNHGWSNVTFKRVNQHSILGRDLLTKVWEFIIE
jgi:hypothetical protein